LKIVIPLFLACFNHLNPIIEACTPIRLHDDELENVNNMFGVPKHPLKNLQMNICHWGVVFVGESTLGWTKMGG
jgi:hypothetical protein